MSLPDVVKIDKIELKFKEILDNFKVQELRIKKIKAHKKKKEQMGKLQTSIETMINKQTSIETMIKKQTLIEKLKDHMNTLQTMIEEIKEQTHA